VLRRLAVDVEDAFRGYLLSEEPRSLTPMAEAEEKLDDALALARNLVRDHPSLADDLLGIDRRLRELLVSKLELIAKFKAGHKAEVLQYVRSGQGLLLSDAIRSDFRLLEDRLDRELHRLEQDGVGISERAFIGLLAALGGLIVLGVLSARVLARSITWPLSQLHESVDQLAGEVSRGGYDGGVRQPRGAQDEITHLTTAYHGMAERIRAYVRELDLLNSIGIEINTIGPDGLDGVLRRIVDRAVELIHADVCLVMLRNDEMGCWIVEAASGEWHDRLYKTVMLWEEFPVSVRAFETRAPAFGDNLRSDSRPQVLRRNVIGDSMLAIPLLSQGKSFGVMVLLSDRPKTAQDWNVRSAEGLAQEAAVAISNARLYDAMQEKQRGLTARLRTLEHLAEELAHDLKGPGQRMGELAALVRQSYESQVDERVTRWLTLIEQNSKDLEERVEGILAVARVGSRQEAVAAVDPALVLGEIMKSRAGELEGRRAQIDVKPGFPMVACHGAYVRQVFDNLISNALKFVSPERTPKIEIRWSVEGHRLLVAVRDNGVGVPESQRDRVFLPFVRLGLGPVQGSGIGLTIVHRIVELYDGRIWIDNNEESGLGCVVKFTLPLLGEFGYGRGDGVSPEASEPMVHNVLPVERMKEKSL
jgi:signal transduction histidine kinase/CHASE3 domain sensor protein